MHQVKIEESNQQNRNEKGEVTTDNVEIQRIISGCDPKVYK